MKLKYHAEVNNVKEAVPYYSKLFEGKVIKDGSFGDHAYVRLFDQIQLTLHTVHREIEKPGQLILKFEPEESKLMDELIARVHESSDETINYELRSFPWGTELFSFKDKYGYTWTLEREG